MKYAKAAVIVLCILILPAATVTAKSSSSSSLKAELTEARDRADALNAQNVSLTAKVTALESELKNIKKGSDNKFMIAGGIGACTTVMCLLIIASLLGKGKTQETGKPKAGSKTGVPTAEEHFSDIEYNVLDDWHNIFYHPERIDKELYADVKNHFEPLYNNMEKWKNGIIRRDALVQEMIGELSIKYKEIETTTSVYMFALPENEPFIEDNEIAIGTFVCAHAKEGFNCDHAHMQSFYSTVMNMFETTYAEAKTLSNEIVDLKGDIDIEIRKIKFNKKLTGDCKYLHASK